MSEAPSTNITIEATQPPPDQPEPKTQRLSNLSQTALSVARSFDSTLQTWSKLYFSYNK